MRSSVNVVVLGIMFLLSTGCSDDAANDTRYQSSGEKSSPVTVTIDEPANTSISKEQQQDLIEAEKKVQEVSEENQEEVKSAELSGDQEEVEEAKIEATKKLAEAEKKVDEELVETTEEEVERN